LPFVNFISSVSKNFSAKKMLETGTWDNECEHGKEMLENMVFDTKVPMSKDLPFIPQKGPNADYFK